MLVDGSIEVLREHPLQIAHGLFAARQDHDIGIHQEIG